MTENFGSLWGISDFDFDITWYLSGPMSGYPEHNYPYFKQVSFLLRSAGIEIRAPHENAWPEHHEQMSPKELWQYMMDRCYEQMEECGGIILLRGWPQSSGSRAELEIAMQKLWPVWYYNSFQLTNMNKS